MHVTELYVKLIDFLSQLPGSKPKQWSQMHEKYTNISTFPSPRDLLYNAMKALKNILLEPFRYIVWRDSKFLYHFMVNWHTIINVRTNKHFCQYINFLELHVWLVPQPPWPWYWPNSNCKEINTLPITCHPILLYHLNFTHSMKRDNSYSSHWLFVGSYQDVELI